MDEVWLNRAGILAEAVSFFLVGVPLGREPLRRAEEAIEDAFNRLIKALSLEEIWSDLNFEQSEKPWRAFLVLGVPAALWGLVLPQAWDSPLAGKIFLAIAAAHLLDLFVILILKVLIKNVTYDDNPVAFAIRLGGIVLRIMWPVLRVVYILVGMEVAVMMELPRNALW